MLYDADMKNSSTTFDAMRAMRAMAWRERRDAIAEGRIENKATTIPNRKAVARKSACRGKVSHDV